MADSLEKLLAEKLARLESVPNVYLHRAVEVEKTMLKRMISMLGLLEKDVNGNVILNRQNLQIVEDIQKEMADILVGPEHQRAIKLFSDEFDKQALLNNNILKKTFGETVPTKIAEQLNTVARNATARNILDISNANISSEVTDFLTNAVSSGQSWSSVVDWATDYFTNNAGTNEGRLIRWTKQIVNDGFNVSDASYTKTVSDTIGAEFFKIVGGIVEETRCFCEQRNGKYFHKLEIEAWGKGKVMTGLEGGKNENCGFPWKGMNRNTNETNIFNFRGGYNCMHSYVPVSVYSVPKPVLIRAIQHGYFKPSDELRSELGLPSA